MLSYGRKRPLLLLEKIPDPVGHGFSVVQIVQQHHIPVSIPLEEPFVEDLPGTESTAARVTGQPEHPDTLFRLCCVRFQVAVNLIG